MSAHPIGSGDRVPQPTRRQFAIHIAERMPSEFTELTRIEALRLPRPVVGPLWFQHAAATLHLPSNYGMPNWEMCIPGVEDGINRLWSTDPMNGISVPEEVRIQRAFNQVLRAQVVTTPADVGLRFPPQVLEGLAWRVLGRVRPEAVAVMCASIALRIEVRGIGSEAEMFAHDVAFLDPLATRLANLARHGAVFLSPDCLRWIIREAAAADIDGSWLATGRCALPNDDDHGAAAAVVFPCLFGDGTPTPSEIIRAFWAIQQVYRFADEAFSSYADATTQVSRR